MPHHAATLTSPLCRSMQKLVALAELGSRTKSLLLMAWATFALTAFISTSARSDDSQPPQNQPAQDKSAYSLFYPTPDSALRSFQTDRPTKSNVPYTVDAGRIQYETDLVNYTLSNYNNVKTTSYEAFDPVWKIGLTQFADFEIQFNGYQNVSIRDASTGNILAHGSGFGDVYFRTKINLMGNDGGKFALAVIPYFKVPTEPPVLSNGVIEGGLIAPLRIAINDDYGVILMTEFNALKNALSNQRHADFANLINFNGPVPGIKDLTFYLEFYSDVGTDRYTPAIYTFDTALSYNITPTLQIDIGANFGLNNAAPKIQIYAGISQRF